MKGSKETEKEEKETCEKETPKEKDEYTFWEQNYNP